jgi:hypothetical protein
MILSPGWLNVVQLERPQTTMLKEQEMMTRREVNTALSSGILIAASPGLRERALKELPPARVDALTAKISS